MPARITADVCEAVHALRAGKLCAVPTETVYGLAGDALQPEVVARIFEAKQRPFFDPLIVHVAQVGDLQSLIREFPPIGQKLAAAFWPGPLTLVLPKTEVVPDLVTAGLSSVAVRIPRHPLMQELLRQFGRPVAAPSANLFGKTSPTTAEHVREQLEGRIDLILDGGACAVGIESTVLHLTDDGPVLLRPGGVTQEELEAVIGPLHLPTTSAPTSPQAAPGQLPAHYAPRTPLIVSSNREFQSGVDRVGLLLFTGADGHEEAGTAGAGPSLTTPARSDRPIAVEILSRTGDLREAAAGFFAALRRLDGLGLNLIIAEPLPETGLGRALNDRLRRAAHGSRAQ